jgi:phenylacetate-CoA ligase
MYSAIYRGLRLLWPGGLSTRRHLRELERTQWLSPEELEVFQLEKIRKLVSHAYENVPFYRERYQKAGIHPQDIRSLEDFRALPFVSREDVNRNLDAMVARNFDRDQLYPDDTGGSTGEPMHFFLEDAFWWWNAANFFRVRAWHGVYEGDKVAWFWGARKDMPEWSWRRRFRSALMRERYINAFNMTESKIAEFAEMLVKWKPKMFKGYASTLSLFARYVQEKGIKGINPRYIESTSEKLSKPQRELLEQVFNCPVADHYSCREMGTMAYQCADGGFHICADVRYLEVVANGENVGPGEMGEVVVTSLNQFAMPFIRYKNGDMGILQGGQCSCGRGLPLLKEIVGRTNDYLVSADGQFVHSEFFAYTFRVKPEVIRYQVYQPDREHLEIRLVCAQEMPEAWIEGVRREIQERFGASMHISMEIVDHIELTPAGKHRYIISEVVPDFAQSG